MDGDGDVVPFYGTLWTHEVVVDGQRQALATDFKEAKIVARAISRVTHPVREVRVYAAFKSMPKTSFRAGVEVN